MDEQRVLAIGASAGGVEALMDLARRLLAATAAPILVVLHIPRSPASRLGEILDNCGSLPAKMAEDDELMQAGHIYVAPTDRHLLVHGARLRLSAGPKENRVRPSIDALFRSAASSFGSRSIGVVLTGMQDDGTAGLWAIKDRGGIAIVQSPEEAAYPSMPLSALRHVNVDYTLRIEAMPDIFKQLLDRAAPLEDSDASARKIALEAGIASGKDALHRGVMQLGKLSPNACPQCHGVLLEIQDGSFVRYRCHTGHAYTWSALLAEVDEQIESSLYQAMRAHEERAFLMKRIEDGKREQGDAEAAERYAREARMSAQRAQQVKAVLADAGTSGDAASP